MGKFDGNFVLESSTNVAGKLKASGKTVSLVVMELIVIEYDNIRYPGRLDQEVS